MYGGFVERARAVSRLIADERTSFLVVSTPEPAPLREAEFFLRELAVRHYEIGALVLNRVLPPSLSRTATEAAADELASAAPAFADAVAGELAVERVVAERVLSTAARATRGGRSWRDARPPHATAW